MKTTIDIPDNLLQEAIELSESRTKREAVISALQEFTRRQRMKRLVKWFGTCEQMITTEELQQERAER